MAKFVSKSKEFRNEEMRRHAQKFEELYKEEEEFTQELAEKHSELEEDDYEEEDDDMNIIAGDSVIIHDPTYLVQAQMSHELW